MDLMGPFEEQAAGDLAVLVFYPPPDQTPSFEDILAALPGEARASGRASLEIRDVSREWVDGWKEYFRPVVIGEVLIVPPWEPGSEGSELARVVINPGLGFGTGQHPTTRGVLRLLQGAPTDEDEPQGRRQERFLGPLVDAGTGSGILAIAAAKLGWGPVFAFDNDPVALISARENIEVNGVGRVVEIHQTDIEDASPYWFAGATVLANMTLEPVVALLRRLAPQAGTWSGAGATAGPPERVIVSGILEGEQETRLLAVARLCGFVPGAKVYEAEWVSVEFTPPPAPPAPDGAWGGW